MPEGHEGWRILSGRLLLWKKRANHSNTVTVTNERVSVKKKHTMPCSSASTIFYYVLSGSIKWRKKEFFFLNQSQRTDIELRNKLLSSLQLSLHNYWGFFFSYSFRYKRNKQKQPQIHRLKLNSPEDRRAVFWEKKVRKTNILFSDTG